MRDRLKEAALTERKKVSDELHAARVEAETSRAWVRRQQEELTQRMRAASSSPRSGSIGAQRRARVGWRFQLGWHGVHILLDRPQT